MHRRPATLESWGQGYGPEAVQAVLRHGLVELGRPLAWAGVAPDNARRLCEKAGMELSGEMLNPRGDLRLIYRTLLDDEAA